MENIQKIVLSTVAKYTVHYTLDLQSSLSKTLEIENSDILKCLHELDKVFEIELPKDINLESLNSNDLCKLVKNRFSH